MSDLKTAALEYHAQPRPGKLSVELTKPTATARDLSLAYSPGVAEPVREIGRDPELAYRYTGKGNLVAVISDGTAILGRFFWASMSDRIGRKTTYVIFFGVGLLLYAAAPCAR